MVSAINSALSGLHAAGKRIQVSAENVANQHSTRTRVNGQVTSQPYAPKRVEQIAQPNGGVEARVQDINPATTAVYAPDHPDADANGNLSLPNVSLENEVVEQKLASYDYKANLRTLKVQDELEKSLLNILS